MEFLKFWNCSLLNFHICNSCYQCVLQHLQLWVVELVTHCKKCCLIKKNKNYWSIYKSISKSPTGFDKVSTTLMLRRNNVDTTLYQRCTTFFRRCFNVVQHRFDVVSKLCNVEKALSDFVSFATSDQRYFNVDTQRWNNVDPQRWNNVALTLKYWMGSSGFPSERFNTIGCKFRDSNSRWRVIRWLWE